MNEDGRGPSIWDRLRAPAGSIVDGSTGDVSADHYHRYKEDIALMKAMGAQTYRFSIAWPRLFPDGSGALNAKGLAFYDRLVDALLEAGHRAVPHALSLGPAAGAAGQGRLADARHRAGARRLRGRSRAAAERPGQPLLHAQRDVDLRRAGLPRGHLRARAEARPGRAQPGAASRGAGAWPRRAGDPRQRAGPAPGSGRRRTSATALPAVETAENIRAAELATRELNAPYLTVMLEGRYTDAYLAAPARTPRSSPRAT